MASKTERPTPKKLREAREQGKVPHSPLLSTAALLLASAAALGAMAPLSVRSFVTCSRGIFKAIAQDASTSGAAAVEVCLEEGLALVLPFVLVVAGAATLAVFLQVGPLWTAKPITRGTENLSLVQGAKRIFSTRRVAEVGFALVSLLVIGWIGADVLHENGRSVLALGTRDAATALTTSGGMIRTLVLRSGAALVALGTLEWGYRQWRHRAELRMTRQEVRREQRETEGDPRAKEQQTRRHRQIVEHAVFEEVRGSSVLLTGSGPLAVALRYSEGDQAPRVTAKGQKTLARRMIAVAERAEVPVTHDEPLTTALYRLDEGTTIPETLYEPVAKWLTNHG